MTAITVPYLGKPMTMRFDGLVTPARNRGLTEAEFRTACVVADRIAELKAAPAGAPQQREGDASLSDPANAWASRVAAWHPLFAKARRDIEHLRLYCQPFTGFDPLTRELNGASPASLPVDLDESLFAAYGNVTIHSAGMIAEQRLLPGYARVQLPLVFGEVGLMFDGVLASYDAWSLQQQMNGLFGSGVLQNLRDRIAQSSAATVVDIGSGFGGLDYQLGLAVGSARLRLVAVDLPDSLVFAAIYLSALWDDRRNYLALPSGYLSITTGNMEERLPEDFGAVFVVNHLAERVLREIEPVDLVLNFRSMQEMSDAQVGFYGQLARDILGRTGLLYEQNGNLRTLDRDVKGILAGIFPHGGLVEETDPPHRGMGQASLWSNSPIDLRRHRD